MNTIINRVNMFPVQAISFLDYGKMSKVSKMSNNKMSLVELRNKQMNETVDRVSFSGLVNR